MSHPFDAPSSRSPGGDEVIRTEGLTKVYRSPNRDRGPEVKAVDELDLSVAKGEIFGLLGPNGAGKTTTVGMLTTRIVPTSGRARVNGVDVVADPAQAKRFIGVVQQVNTLDRSLNVFENLYFHGRYYAMSHHAAREQAEALLERFRLAQRARADVRALSGGMARRLMVARAVMHRPAVLFLDEPTAGLDPQSRLALWEMVGELHDEGQTILLTTHYMEEAEEFCDRVAIMDHGNILALDTPAALKRSAAAIGGPTVDAKAWLARLRALEGTAGSPWRRLGWRWPRSRTTAASANGADVEAALVDLIAAAERHNLSLDDLRGHVTLETVFINLTGRDLRE